MSLFYFLACVRPLPTGSFGVREPLAVYDTWAEYLASPHYRPHQGPGVSLDQIIDFHELPGPFPVYDSMEDAESIIIQPYTYADLRDQFEGSFIYTLGISCCMPKLVHYLQSFLAPGETAEFFCCWDSGELETETRKRTRDIDYQLKPVHTNHEIEELVQLTRIAGQYIRFRAAGSRSGEPIKASPVYDPPVSSFAARGDGQKVCRP